MSAPATPYVVVGVDGSAESEHALRWAEFIARQTGSEVRAVMSWSPVLPGGGVAVLGPDGWDPEADTRQILATTVRKVLGETPSVAVEERVVEGGAAKSLLEESAEARMLVVGSRGRGGFAGLLLGSVSAVCAAHAKCPVLIIHGDTPLPE
ncbi:universal stress protein [Amycolatopsis sp. NPDC051903]|uniref:universal stress protein n=1 Tax=Amycolatopsis sp. NPDC051903 TaxID=3363936 RepID=UPI00379B08BF